MCGGLVRLRVWSALEVRGNRRDGAWPYGVAPSAFSGDVEHATKPTIFTLRIRTIAA